jgi:hypothetical protein
MTGRWTLLVNRNGEAWTVDPDVSVFPQHGEALTPVVPCDNAAIERAQAALCRWSPSYFAARPHIAREVAELVLRAAGDRPASDDHQHLSGEGVASGSGSAQAPKSRLFGPAAPSPDEKPASDEGREAR